MSSDDRGLQLHVPLFSHGFTYQVRTSRCTPPVLLEGVADQSAPASQNITLKGFASTFEILVLDAETSEVHSAAAETCSFTASEFICKNEHITPILASLHWPPVHFKILLLVFKSLNSPAPPCL